jgi:hypothetical protein
MGYNHVLLYCSTSAESSCFHRNIKYSNDLYYTIKDNKISELNYNTLSIKLNPMLSEKHISLTNPLSLLKMWMITKKKKKTAKSTA